MANCKGEINIFMSKLYENCYITEIMITDNTV